MIFKMRWSLIGLVPIFVSLMSSVNATGQSITVATYRYSEIDRLAAIQPLGNYIGNELGRKTEIREYDSPTELIDAIEKGEVDIAVPNLFGFLDSLSRKLNVQAVAVPDVPNEKALQYRSVLIAKSGSRIKVESDILRHAKNTKVALVWKDSTSGGIVPMVRLKELGVDDANAQFKHFIYAGSHEKALDKLLNSEVGLAGLALGVLDERLLAQPELSQSISVVWTSPPIPMGPVLCVRNRSIDCDLLSQRLLEKNDDNAQIMAALNIGWPEFGGAEVLVAPKVEVYERLLLEK